MKAIYPAFLFCLVASLLSGQESKVPDNQPAIRFHYSLVGSAGAVDVEISLDNFLNPWLIQSFKELGASEDLNGKDSDRFKADVWALCGKMAEKQLFGFAVEISNRTDQSIELSVFTDILTLSTGKSQMDFRPDPASLSTYPSKLLRHSRIRIQFPFPQETPDDKIRAMNTVAYMAGLWTGVNQRLMNWVRLKWSEGTVDIDQLKDQARAMLEEKSSEIANSSVWSFGELTLGSAGVEIPLEMKISLADDKE